MSKSKSKYPDKAEDEVKGGGNGTHAVDIATFGKYYSKQMDR